MLTLLMPLLIAIATPLPSPSAAPPSALKEIGRVESMSVCPAIVVHANSAIGEALDNDAQLGIVINRLRTTDLDASNVIVAHNAMTDLSTLAGRLRFGAAAGNGEIKRLRTIAASTADPVRAAELKAFADALGGALARQRKAGTDLDRFLTIIDGRRAIEELNTDDLIAQRESIAAPDGGSRGPLTSTGVMRSPVGSASRQAVNAALREVADDFASRTGSILRDEGVAADHSLGATTGC